ncbi:MAG: AEC family transporter [Lyngbya sp.]|nr:AEC family transporter [Lyngbya sp.]
MIVILSAILPVACIVLIGFIVGKKLNLDISTLSRLSLYVLFPALIIDNLYKTTLSGENAIAIVIGFLITFVLLGIIAWQLSNYWQFSTDLKKSLVTTTALPNVGNLGLPVTLFALGEAGLERAIVYLIAWNIVVLTTVPAFLQNGGFRSSIKFMLKLPLTWAVTFGVCLRVFNIQLPLKLDEGLDLLANAAIPLALLMLGVQIANNRLAVNLYEVGASFLRLLGGAAIALIVGKLLGLEELDLKVLVLQSSMPTAITAFLMVNEFGGDAVQTARVVVVSTLFAFITLPGVLFALQTFV